MGYSARYTQIAILRSIVFGHPPRFGPSDSNVGSLCSCGLGASSFVKAAKLALEYQDHQSWWRSAAWLQHPRAE